MSDIDSILKTLDAELESAAKLEATVTAEGSAAQAQQTAVQQARVKLQQAKAALEALKLELQTRDKAVRDRAQQYFDDIEPVRKAVSAGGALADTVETAQSDAVGKALGITQNKVDELMQEVTKVDAAAEKERADAVNKVKEVTAKLDTWDDAFKASREVIDAVEKALGTLATGATQLAAKGRIDLESLDKALTAGKSDAKKYYEAVVHLSDLHTHHAALVGPILQVPQFPTQPKDLMKKLEELKEKLKPESLEFDADELTASKLSGDILKVWDEIRKTVESTASERFKAEVEVIKNDIELAEKQADYKLYQVKRVEDAAKAVEEKHAGAGGGGTGGGGTGGAGGGAGGGSGGAGGGSNP